MMKNKWMVTAGLVLSMFAFTACGKKEETMKETAPAAAVEEVQTEVEEAEAGKEEFLADFSGEMDLAGSWQDEVSQRATMDVEVAQTGTCHVLIHWASGAKEASIWEISGIYDETSGMLTYKDGHYSVHTWDDNDKETVTGEELTEGALMKEGDKLRWQDSKNTEDGLFVKVSD